MPFFLLFGGICTVGTFGTNSARLYYGAGNSSPIEVAKQSEVESLKSSVSEGKSLIASAITDKGVSTSSTATFQTMANTILAIATFPYVYYTGTRTTTSSFSITVYTSRIIMFQSSVGDNFGIFTAIRYVNGNTIIADTDYGNVSQTAANSMSATIRYSPSPQYTIVFSKGNFNSVAHEYIIIGFDQIIS